MPTIQSVLAKAHKLKELAIRDLPDSEDSLPEIMEDIRTLILMQSKVDRMDVAFDASIGVVSLPDEQRNEIIDSARELITDSTDLDQDKTDN